MKILLTAINAKYIHSNLGIYSLKAYCREFKEEIEIAEYTINQLTEYILRDIYKRYPDVIAFSAYIWNITVIRELICDIKKIMPSVKIWLGGPEVSFETEKFMIENPEVDIVMLGEGERSFKALVSNEKPLENIASIAYRYGEDIIINSADDYINMDEIPFVYENISDFDNRIIYYESSRGCPFSCSYCMSSIDKRVRYRSMELVKKELKFFIDAKVKQVKFVDRTFNCNRKRTKEIWQFLIDNDNLITNFHFEISADLLNDEEILLLSKMRKGLVQLEIGVQTTNINTLNEICRYTDFSVLSENVTKINSLKNVHQHLDLIAGLPFENLESFKKSFNDVYSLSPEQLQLGFLKVLKGSKIYKQAHKYNLNYKHNPNYEVLNTAWLSYDNIIELKKLEEMLEVHYNSRQFIRSEKYLSSLFKTPYDFYSKLADYYEKNSLFNLNHSRENRFNILHAFASGISSCNTALLDELLIFDLYARDNCKTRPLWAKNLKNYKDKFVKFYKSEEASPNYLKEYTELNYRQTLNLSHIEFFEYDVTSDTFDKGDCYVLFKYLNRDRSSMNVEYYKITL